MIFDRQYSPFIFEFQGQISSRRKAYTRLSRPNRSSMPPRSITRRKKSRASGSCIEQAFLSRTREECCRRSRCTTSLGGLLTFESEWNPPMGKPLLDALGPGRKAASRSGLRGGARHFRVRRRRMPRVKPQGKAATAFLFELIARLQMSYRADD